MRHYTAEPAVRHRAEHAEGPSWDARTGQLLWVDQFDGLVHLADYSPDTGTLAVARTFEIGVPVGAVVPCRAGGWLLACGHGFGYLRADGDVRMLAQPEPETTRMNDGKCDPTGAFWAGSMAWAKTHGAGTLYRLTRDGTVETVRPGVTISNGLAWYDDHVYYIDTPTQRIDRFHIGSDGAMTDQTTVVVIDPADGHPDGMCVDTDGCLWVALWNGSSVRRYAPTGELLATVEVAAPQVSSCCFGGPDGSTLFVTTSQEDMSAEQRSRHPGSGLVFRVDVDATGLPAAEYVPEWLP